MIKVALDVMGGDHAPQAVIEGGLLALAELADLHISFVGPQAVLGKYLDSNKYDQKRAALIQAEEIVADDEAPVLAVRRKKKSSMMVALQMLREKKVDAVVSAGNTGALMAGSILLTGRVKGIERPALTIVLPTFEGGNVVLLDVGANMDAKAEHLLHYAIMGKIYAQKVLGKAAARVGLLNVGSEEIKGNEQVKKAYQLLKEKLPGFTGNVEARYVLAGAADVIVCDGFVGNILLKTLEGLVAGLFGSLKEAMMADLKGKVAASLLRPELSKLKASLDYTEYGGAPLLGAAGVCIKAHGSSNARAIRSAIVNQAYQYARQNVNELIERELSALFTD